MAENSVDLRNGKGADAIVSPSRPSRKLAGMALVGGDAQPTLATTRLAGGTGGRYLSPRSSVFPVVTSCFARRESSRGFGRELRRTEREDYTGSRLCEGGTMDRSGAPILLINQLVGLL